MLARMSIEDQTRHLSLQDVALLLQTNDKLRHSNSELETQVKSLQKQLDWFKRQLFGQTSEKRLIDTAPGQGQLFSALAPTPIENIPTDKITYERAKARKCRDEAVTDSGLRFDDSVEVQEIRIAVPELEGADAEHYTVIDERITYRLAQRRSSYVVLKYIQAVIKHKQSGQLTTKSAPTPVFEKSLADVSFLTGLLIDKFLYHQPLYRQHQRLLINGITLSRTTLTNYVHRTIQLLELIYDAMLRNILRSKVLAMDETPTKAGRKHKGKMQQAWYWPLLGEMNEIAFHFSPTRARKVVDELLKDFTGTLVTDGYPVYSAYVKDNQSVTHAQCWMHNRRGYVEAEKEEPKAVAHALEMIGLLYAHETMIKDKQLDDVAALNYRTDYCKPVVETFFDWVQAQRQRADLNPKSDFTKALQYSANHEDKLKIFLSDPRVPADTGAVERGLRPIALGRRNWLFSWTEVGAQYTGIIQSLIATCRMHKINPADYLTDVIERVDTHPASAVDELTPRLWKEKYGKSPLRSVVDRVNNALV